MKKLFSISCFLLISLISGAQIQQGSSGDTTIQFKVYGTCDLCKERIEKAAMIRGVSSANWDVQTKNLSLTLTNAGILLPRIENRIVTAGHDLELKKTTDAAYAQLPACCRYREMNSMSPGLLQGLVLEEDAKGNFNPLAGASIFWQGTNTGVTSDSNGIFKIRQFDDSLPLVISYTGYQADTIFILNNHDLKIILAADNRLKEVVIKSRQRSTYISNLQTIRTQIVTGKELLKAACCNLSESFETNPSVDVSYSDAVSGSKQIQLLGLSGNYTQLTVENLPGPRGIATPLGLNSIAGPWIESIQLTKGIGSVVNGYESIAGQINVELKKPESSEPLLFNLYVNDQGKTDLNLNLARKINKKWSVGLLLHNDFLFNKELDNNNDGFRDLPTGNLFSLVNRWKYDNGKGLLTQFGIKFMDDVRTGGQLFFDPGKDRNTTRAYGLGIHTDRYELFSKMGYIFSQKKYKSIGLQLSAIRHKQDAYFGFTNFDAEQKTFYANLIYQSIIGTTAHKFRTGLSLQADTYDEQLNALEFNRNETVPGAFFEYTWIPGTKINIVAGLRADNSNLTGFFITPRLHIKYEPLPGTSFRISAGRGQRVANILAENNSVFASARTLVIPPGSQNKAYGLNPEIAWNKGVSFDQKLRLLGRDAMVSIDFFRNDFSSQVVTDLENPREVRFYNLAGKSFSNSLQAEFSFQPIEKLEWRLAYRFFDVRMTYGDKLLQRPLSARHRAFANFSYAIEKWKFDYTINYTGPKRIPNTGENPVEYQLPSSSPGFIVMNANISKTLFKNRPVDLYIGGENLGNFLQDRPIISASQPFSPWFDASLVWGPLGGRMLYAGLRFKLD